MRLVLAADHRGYCLKNVIAQHLRNSGHEVTDIGTNDATPVDFPDITLAAALQIRGGKAERGVVVCGSGVGACIAANKLRGLRAALTHDTYSAHQGVEHDDMNVVCLGSRVIGDALALEIVRAFLAASFVSNERYARRRRKVNALDQGASAEQTARTG